MLIEVIATTLKEALDIEQAGADRIELVSGILEGGLTPSIALINEVCNNVKIPVNVMVRPHSKSFHYNETDIKVILRDIEEIKKSKANGIVFGCLTKDNEIDTPLLDKVISKKGNLSLTFHRAIDEARDIIDSFKTLLNYDINTILTSAGKNKVVMDIPTLNKLIFLTKNHSIQVLAGSGLNDSNILTFLKETPVQEIHIGSGAKKGRNNLNEIDIEMLSSVITSIKKEG